LLRREVIGTDGRFGGLDTGTVGGFGGLDNGTVRGFGGLDNGTDGGSRGVDNGTVGEVVTPAWPRVLLAGEDVGVGWVGGPAVGGGSGFIEGVVEVVEPSAFGCAPRVVEIGKRSSFQDRGGFRCGEGFGRESRG
jgi:hypothetical protein